MDTEYATRDNIETISKYAAELEARRSGHWAWTNYKSCVHSLVRQTRAQTVMEIGGGRWPLFSNEEISSSGVTYIVNDVSESELALAPANVEKVCFDIGQGDLSEHEALKGKVDVIFSQMVFEHVGDARQAYKNIYSLLAPGGVCLNFHPVLYSLPFVVNWLLPETLSSRLLRLFFPYRHANDTPKHPAKYDLCVINQRSRDAIHSAGFREVWQIPFWHHGYFQKIPGLYQIDTAITNLADRNNWTGYASFSYTLVLK